ncbi:MAG: DUF302 domain-containing protein [Thiobacillaceae bacterium]|jgi:uncharacterized protein (DUF302 family)|nr:DUF302 domain-containing protein [Thiobacillaceae bacterium]
MKRSLVLSALLLSFGLAAGSLPAHADAVATPARAIVTEDISPAGFAATLAALKAQLGADGWTLLAEIDLGARIAKKGTQLPGGLVILELASGGNTIPLLKNETTRYVAGLMPCSVSVYAMDDGRVVVSRMNTAALAGMMEPRVAEALKQSAARLDASIAAALAKAGG